MKKTNETYGAQIIAYYTGYIVFIVSLLMIIPILSSVAFMEWNTMLDFMISWSIATLIGILMMIYGIKAKKSGSNMQWKHGFSIAAFAWILLTILCAIPYLLSGHTKSLLDACFDVMSGFTTTGLVLTQDLDHLSVGLNMWRHMLTFIGGQGMVVLALTFLTKEIGGAYKMYVGEGKDIELRPNIKGTTRHIWKISLIYLIIGTAVLWIAGMM
ncbi:MAG: potassium transporter TrkG, partial [Mobilitalea sp.]